MKSQQVAVLGLGKIGSILLQGLLKAGLPADNAGSVNNVSIFSVRGCFCGHDTTFHSFLF